MIRRGSIGTNEEQAIDSPTCGASGSAEPEGDFDIGVDSLFDSVRLREGEIEYVQSILYSALSIWRVPHAFGFRRFHPTPAKLVVRHFSK